MTYTFNPLYFPPRWENVDAVNRFLSRYYAPLVEREIIYRYPRFDRNIQLLRMTDPAVPLGTKQVILLTGRVHNPESGMTTALYRFAKWLLEPEGRPFLRDYLFLIMPLTMPLTVDEAPRQHNVNREWTEDMSEPDILAIRDRVIDRYVPEIWLDCHSFNQVLDLTAPPVRRREQDGDYVVAFPVGEAEFDHEYSRQIAARLIQAAAQQGHVHRRLDRWRRDFASGPWVRPGEKIWTEHDPVGIFSARDYARYADRGKYGFAGRDWPAMACEYGYCRCHAVNLCLECKPLHVGDIHYSPRYPDSHVVKLKELCRLGQEWFAGQPTAGFPCHLIATDVLQRPDSAFLTDWGQDHVERRVSRQMLWRHRHTIVLHRPEHGRPVVAVECVRNIEIDAALRFPLPPCRQVSRVMIAGRATRRFQLGNGYLFVPFYLHQGLTEIKINYAK